jgi:hypothetical protein
MQRSVQWGSFWDSTGEQTNPTAAGAALADSGNLAPGQYECIVTVSATASAQFSIQHRNVADSANLDDPIVVYMVANGSGQFLCNFSVVDSGESIRVKMDTDLTGVAAAHVQVTRVA